MPPALLALRRGSDHLFYLTDEIEGRSSHDLNVDFKLPLALA